MHLFANFNQHHITATLWSIAIYSTAGASAGFILGYAANDLLCAVPECAEFVGLDGMAILEGENRHCIEKLGDMGFRELKALGRAKFYGHRTECLNPFWSAALTVTTTLTGALAGAAYGYRRARIIPEQEHTA